MHLIFGQELDGCPLPESEQGLNKAAFGTRGLLDFLELRLGLPPASLTQTARLLLYREALKETSAKRSCFFETSFSIDPLGSSKVLLQWRDNLRLNGWNGDPVFRDSAPTRLSDFAAVEPVFEGLCKGTSRDEAFRLERVADHLRRGASPQIERIDLIETLPHFPHAWQKVLEQLPVAPRAFPLPREPLAASGTVLHAVQSSLLGNDVATIDQRDDSIGIVRDPVLSLNAHATAEHLANRKANPIPPCKTSMNRDRDSETAHPSDHSCNSHPSYFGSIGLPFIPRPGWSFSCTRSRRFPENWPVVSPPH